MLEEFGKKRVIDTPISEGAINGLATGIYASLGLRPIVDITFMDFVTIAMDAIVNQVRSYALYAWWASSKFL